MAFFPMKKSMQQLKQHRMMILVKLENKVLKPFLNLQNCNCSAKMTGLLRRYALRNDAFYFSIRRTQHAAPLRNLR
jgi:hypothetical protein